MTHNNHSNNRSESPYITTELDIASFLVASGYRVLDSQPHGPIVQFTFDPSATTAVEGYFSGASLPVQEVFRAHRHLRTMIKQIKNHVFTSRNSEQNHEQYRFFQQ